MKSRSPRSSVNQREAKAISSLNHPNICILFDIGHEDGRDFLVMEYIPGQTLAERLKDPDLRARIHAAQVRYFVANSAFIENPLRLVGVTKSQRRDAR